MHYTIYIFLAQITFVAPPLPYLARPIWPGPRSILAPPPLYSGPASALFRPRLRCRDALATSTINCMTSFWAGFVIFSVLGYMAKKTGKQIKDVATEGQTLGGAVLLELFQLWRSTSCGKII